MAGWRARIRETGLAQAPVGAREVSEGGRVPRWLATKPAVRVYASEGAAGERLCTVAPERGEQGRPRWRGGRGREEDRCPHRGRRVWAAVVEGVTGTASTERVQADG